MQRFTACGGFLYDGVCWLGFDWTTYDIYPARTANAVRNERIARFILRSNFSVLRWFGKFWNQRHSLCVKEKMTGRERQ